MSTHVPGGVLLDLTPLETISSLRGIGRYVRGLASGLELLQRERVLQTEIEGVAASRELNELFLVPDLYEYCKRPATQPVARSPHLRRRLIERKMARLAGARPRLLHLADPNGVPPAKSVPFTLTCHDLIPLVLRRDYLAPVPLWPALYGAIERSHYRRTRRVLAVSHATKRDVCEHLGIADELVDVVWHGVDHDSFNLRAEPNERARLDAVVGGAGPYVLYLGAGDVRKDLDTLLTAFAASGLQRDLRLVLAGNLGAKRTRSLTTLTGKLRIEGAVQFAGYVAEDLVPALYRQAAAHAFLSRYEGFGLPVVEAMACGVPTVTSMGSSLDEVAGDGALVVPWGEVDALCAALNTALFDSEQRAALKQRGLARALSFTWRKCAEQTLEFWQRAAT